MIELVQLTRKYLEEEYDAKEWIMTSPECTQFFRELAVKAKPVAKQAPPPPPKPSGKFRSLAKKKKEPKKVESKPIETPEPVTIQPVKKEKPDDLTPQLELIRQVCPKIVILDQIPEPRGPKKVVIVCDLNPFWKKVAGALIDRGFIVNLIGLDDDIGEVDLVLKPRSLERQIEGIECIETEKAALYLQDTYLKKVLWQALCQKLNM